VWAQNGHSLGTNQNEWKSALCNLVFVMTNSPTLIE